MLNVVSQACEPHAEQMHRLCTYLSSSCRSLNGSGKLPEAFESYLDNKSSQVVSESCRTASQKERSCRNGLYFYSPNARAVGIHVLKCDWLDKKVPSPLLVTCLMANGIF